MKRAITELTEFQRGFLWGRMYATYAHEVMRTGLPLATFMEQIDRGAVEASLAFNDDLDHDEQFNAVRCYLKHAERFKSIRWPEGLTP